MFNIKSKLKDKKSAKKQSKYKSIFTVDAYEDRFYKQYNNKIEPKKKAEYNTSNYVTSYMSNKDLISSVIEISNSIPEEDVDDTIELKTYEELGLDQANTYIISSVETTEVDNHRHFQVFVTEPETIQERFKQVLVDVKFIDLIIPSPLLYKTLYANKILHNVGVDCFIYFTRYDTVVVIYQDGEYLYSKSIEHSLTRIYEKYLEMPGERMDEDKFYKILGTEGLKSTDSDYQKDVMKIFGEVFIGINDILIYAKRAFDLESIDKVYVGSEFGPILGLEDYSQTYLGHVLSELNFDYSFESDEWYLEQFQCLMALTAIGYLNEEDNNLVNLTQFYRPPPFHMRPGGQFIISTTIASIVGITYPSVYLVGAYANKLEIHLLEDKKTKLTNIANNYKKILANKSAISKKLDAEIEKLDITYSSKIKTLSAIYNKKVHYKLKSESLYKFAGDLKKHDVRTDSISSKNDSYQISLVSESSKSITTLIKSISEEYFDVIKNIDISEIIYDTDTGYYRGLLKVDLK
ncbi:FIG00470756: hypothetical protein [hydrothermal vent metagenome]|uniref:Uncharacterized protein n=1 Tax=hydrothermal vent metagenome TaxID=652676 RepID=A0A1W1EKC9_9ZZZZ